MVTHTHTPQIFASTILVRFLFGSDRTTLMHILLSKSHFLIVLMKIIVKILFMSITQNFTQFGQ